MTDVVIIYSMKLRRGSVNISGLNTVPEKHELKTANYFADRGIDVEFIVPHYNKGVKNPDIYMAGKVWEMKSPLGASNRVFENSLRKAMKQSENIIIDLRRLKNDNENWCLNKIKLQMNSAKIKTLLVITKNGELLTLKGRIDIM